MKPIIGVTVDKIISDGYCYERINEYNLKALILSGAIPLMLPITGEDDLIDAYIEIVNGLLFSGGNDISPLIFGEDPIREVKVIDYDRDDFEIKLFKKAASKNMPILGICRGSQVINVAAGGSLYQDIYVQKDGTRGHKPEFESAWYPHHRVSITRDSILYNILQTEEISVNSYHHQAVKDLAQGYRVSALSKDGIIEAIESVNHSFIVGVQWHPEMMIEKYPVFLRIFEALVEAASKK
ncbi:MAG TPA: gamma-glutamyl-gamma-aminobutyrate hydrolase family protein [Sedimentibacter sp.]|nr:gamma-glutamyl-gamma-aminobutyrate hydrolase family protein [Sedimentibacter sp.]HOW22178.1 gamma-glutamyl-gamma-aminobutyrate hydrolase family protein [Sedimentibacter sp.]HRC79748.1 gamma-glutamyl-gamma-aminobutyrate hydrolase family protein [Sedimentibacter sp.]